MANTGAPQQFDDLLNAGYQALAEGAWALSRATFEAAVAAQETPEALEGLGMAAWWLDDAPVVFESRERAYRLYRQCGDRPGAARTAVWLGLDYYVYRGEPAITNGWLERARRLLVGIEPSFEHGWLMLIDAYIALFEYNDVVRAKRASAEALGLARSLGIVDLEMFALATEGLALVSEGQISEGMRRLDEATTAALAGEMTDPDAIVTSCCYLIYACERVRDYERAAQWCTKVAEICRRWSYRSVLAICRVHYAAVLMWRGEWEQSDIELTAAMAELAAARPGWVDEATLRLGELRRRQGRLDEAARLFEGARLPPALLGQAHLALARGDVLVAADLIDRFLRRVPAEDRTERAHGLEVAVRVQTELGALDRARELLAELDAVAELVGTEPLRGSASLAHGVLAGAAGDLDAARRAYEDAVDLFDHCEAPYEAALSRIDLAHALTATGRQARAISEARTALATLRQIGALGEAGRVTALLRDLGVAFPDDGREVSKAAGLTRREAEVLSLIAHGRSNQQIAEQLFLSVRTVERHISTIYEKIGAEGTAARAIATAWAIERGLTQILDS